MSKAPGIPPKRPTVWLHADGSVVLIVVVLIVVVLPDGLNAEKEFGPRGLIKVRLFIVLTCRSGPDPAAPHTHQRQRG